MKKKIKIEKSRVLLKQALLHLLLEKPYKKISIQDLCHQAKVGRSTFYNHYYDKNDFESSIMKLATSPCLKIFVLLSFSKPVISFDNRLETVRLSSQG